MKEQVIWYLATANEDNHAVRVLVKKREFAKAGFHCQQMAEKAFKALIAQRGKVPPAHDLLGLMHFLEKCNHFEVPGKVKAKASKLDAFYLGSRHPQRGGEQSTREAIEELYDCARTIMRFAEDQLEEEITLASDVGI
ncbi:MAG: hypothetical protein AMJ41_03280 [candidate division Zixibacteria bacterium DG_27]|nr:MAG: hypothetical protein AMJ41_03280 [candidate division Zixibacteria bacterium DG_27]